jgi:transposase
MAFITAALDRLVAGHVDWDNFKSLDTLGIDEITLKKVHDEYMTIISTRFNDGKIRVLAVIEGRGKAHIKSFLSLFRDDYKKPSKAFATT